MRLWGSISGITFISLIGIVGGLECNTLTFIQFNVSVVIALVIFGFSLNKCSKIFEENEYKEKHHNGCNQV